jgi:hypothetical protein
MDLQTVCHYFNLKGSFDWSWYFVKNCIASLEVVKTSRQCVKPIFSPLIKFIIVFCFTLNVTTLGEYINLFQVQKYLSWGYFLINRKCRQRDQLKFNH